MIQEKWREKASKFMKFFDPLGFINKMTFFYAKTKTIDGIEYSSFGTRNLSTLIDLIILACLFYLIYSIYVAVMPTPQISLTVLEKHNLSLELTPTEIHQLFYAMFFHIMSNVLQLATIIAYLLFCWSNFSATFGKKLLGMIIVDKNTFEIITFKRALKRILACLVSVLPLGIGLIWSIFDKKSQTIHDKIVGTVVISKKSWTKYHNIDSND
ncbi:MAG: RDD family protein [Anaplasmataceae bacterium]|nr:RDD family protein [Anaplasmataceae bacterium]